MPPKFTEDEVKYAFAAAIHLDQLPDSRHGRTMREIAQKMYQWQTIDRHSDPLIDRLAKECTATSLEAATEILSLQMRVVQLTSALRLFSSMGTSHDVCPTRQIPGTDEAARLDAFWLSHFRSADEHVRNVAGAVLKQPAMADRIVTEHEIAEALDQLGAGDTASGLANQIVNFGVRRRNLG